VTLPPVDYAFRANAGDGGSPWLVREIEVSEELSGEFTAAVDLESDDPLADPGELLGAPATLTLSRPTPDPLVRSWSGVVRAVHEPWAADAGARLRCRVVLEPAVTCLDDEVLTRKLQEVTVPEVLRQVLGRFVADFARNYARPGEPPPERAFELRLAREDEPPRSPRRYARRDLCVQYGETTFAFLRRLMSEEGMSFFFEQEEARERLIVVDDNAAFARAGEPVLLCPPDGLATAHEAVHRFALARRSTARCAETRTFDLTQHRTVTAKYPAEAQAEVDKAGGPQLYLAGSGVTLHGYQDDAYRLDDAAVQARLALERANARAVLGRGRGDVIGFRPGLVFALEPDERLASPHLAGNYLMVKVRHRGARAAVYANQFACVPSHVPARPVLLPKPRAIEDHAVVVSVSDSDPIHTDPHGRVRVRFGYDREEGVAAERRSPWIPVAQPWAGPGFGVQIIPRAGMLVRLRYLHGDPDRPCVVGCLPTAVNLLPSRPPAEKTRLTIRTRSLGGGDHTRDNEITLDDDAGQETVFVRARRDCHVKVLNDQRTDIGRDETRLVGGNQKTEIQGDRVLTVQGGETVKVEGDQTVEVGGARTTTVGDRDTGRFLAGREETVEGTDSLHVSERLSMTADREWCATQGPTELALREGNAVLRAAGAIRLEVPGARLELDRAGNAVLRCDRLLSLRCGEASIVLEPDRIRIAAPQVELAGANGALRLDRGGAATSGLQVSSKATLSNEISGAIVKAN
jgi:type VI secretion system secreted protein VgrG